MNKQQLLTTLRNARKELLRQGLGGEETAALLHAVRQITAEVVIDGVNDAKHAELVHTGKCAADSLREMVAALECDYDRLERLDALRDNWGADEMAEYEALKAAAGECTSRDDAEQRIQEDALSVEVRSEWHSPGDANGVENVEFQILLSTGGPATRIMGKLHDGEPYRAWLEVQDWGTPWTHYYEEGLCDVLLTYARCFYFGEG